jgi:quercetin dioxygenase-like cupin family protein
MPSDRSRRKTPETLGSGVFDPRVFQLFSREGPNVASIYGDATDMSVVVWNLEPGQENSVHSHPTNAHAIIVLEGIGVYLRGQGEATPITAGQLVVVPRNVPHGIRNTGASRLSYLAVSSWESGGGYVRAEASKQVESPH